MKKCIFDEKKLCSSCGECDLCDLNRNKVCDNCGKCLEAEGVDIRAIRIEEISKNVEENQVVEEDFVEISNDIENIRDEVEDGESFENLYTILDLDLESTGLDDSDKDLWDNIEYIEDLDEQLLSDTNNLTEEYYPGLLRLKVRKK